MTIKVNGFRKVFTRIAIILMFLMIAMIISETTSFAITLKSTDTVYRTRTGEKYHLSGCTSLYRSKIKTTVAEAQAMGLTPCKNCIGSVTVTKPSSSSKPSKVTTKVTPTKTTLVAKKSSVWKRLSGKGRYDTMKVIVDEGFTKAGGTVVIAVGTGFKDALSASGFAGLYDAPIVLTDGNALSTQASSVLKRIKPKNVFVAGGKMVVKDKVLSDIKKATGVTPKRVAGTNSSDTSAKLAIAGKGKWSKEKIAVLVTNASFKDALSVAPLAYANKWPVFIADQGKSVSDSVIKAINDLDITNMIVVGGERAVSDSLLKTITSKTEIVKCQRVAGANGADTSAKVAEMGIKMGLSPNKMAVATSQNYPDALAGAALCGYNKSVLVLADDKTMLNATFPKKYKSSLKRCYVLGGDGAVGIKTWNALVSNTK